MTKTEHALYMQARRDQARLRRICIECTSRQAERLSVKCDLCNKRGRRRPR